MHKILVKTHRESNINILKARDYYFDRARLVNNRFRAFCLYAPITVSLVGIAACAAIGVAFPDDSIPSRIASRVADSLDTVVGVTAILAFALDCLFQRLVDDNLTKSNALRELYDCRVMDIKPNEFHYRLSDRTIAEYLQKHRYVKDSGKYEVWYREIFSTNDFANSICNMMDNVIYTSHVYLAYKKRVGMKLSAYAILFFAYSAFYFFGGDYFAAALINPMIIFMAIFDAVKDLVNSYATAKGLAEDNASLKDYVFDNKDSIIADEARIHAYFTLHRGRRHQQSRKRLVHPKVNPHQVSFQYERVLSGSRQDQGRILRKRRL